MSNDFMVSMVSIANDVRDALSRVIRLESQIASVNVSTNQYSTATHDILYRVSVMQAQLLNLQTAINTSKPISDESNVAKLSQNSTSSNESQLSTDFCAFESCKECLSLCNRPCSAGMSLRHMLECASCPADVCRVTFILNHMSNFVRAPQVLLHTSNFTLHTSHLFAYFLHLTPGLSCGHLLLLRNEDGYLDS
jgi:hypothetical protein